MLLLVKTLYFNVNLTNLIKWNMDESIFNAPIINIDWKLKEKDIHLSKKDSELAILSKSDYNFIYIR